MYQSNLRPPPPINLWLQKHSHIKNLPIFCHIIRGEMGFQILTLFLFKQHSNQEKQETMVALAFQPSFRTLAQALGLSLRMFPLSFLTLRRGKAPRLLSLFWTPSLMMIYGGPFPSALLGAQTCDAACLGIHRRIINCVNPS